MENNRAFWIQNAVFGALVGLTLVATSFVYFKTGQNVSINPQLNNVLMLLSIAGIFIGVQKYRNDNLNGTISYKKALGACMWLITTASVIYGAFIYILYSSNPDQVGNYITAVEEAFKELYADSAMLSTLTNMTRTFTTPASLAVGEIFNKIFAGFFFHCSLPDC